jgi:hypothetical protein
MACTPRSARSATPKSYVSRILKRALLAPDLVEGMVAGTADQALVLVGLERPCRWIGVSSAHLFRHESVVGGFFRLISLNQTFAWRGPYRRIGLEARCPHW